MKMRFALLVGCIAAAVALCSLGDQVSHAAPGNSTWEVTNYVMHSDTLPEFGTASTGDSVVTTPGIYIFGARYIVITVSSNANDSIFVPTVQLRTVGSGAWVGTGGAAFAPYSGWTTSSSGLTATSLVSGVPRACYFALNEPTIQSSTIVPMITDSLRLRIKSSNTRRPAPPFDHLPGSSGRYTFIAYVWR